jgi:hypothetical protein
MSGPAFSSPTPGQPFNTLPSYELKKGDTEADAEAEGVNISFNTLPSYGLKQKREFKAQVEGVNILGEAHAKI